MLANVTLISLGIRGLTSISPLFTTSSIYLKNSKFSQSFSSIIYSNPKLINIDSSSFKSILSRTLIFSKINQLSHSRHHIFELDSAVNISNSIFENCSAISDLLSYSSGASIYSFGCTISIDNCSFINGLSKYGSAIASIESDIIISKCLFLNGIAQKSFGAIWILNCNYSKISFSNFLNNQAYKYYGGISIYNQYIDSTTIIENCIVSNNSAELGIGGIGICSNGKSFLSNITLSNNKCISEESSVEGSALYFEGSINENEIHFVYLSKVMLHKHDQEGNNISSLSFSGKVKIIIEDWACSDGIYNYMDKNYNYGDKILENVSDIEQCAHNFFPSSSDFSMNNFFEPSSFFDQTNLEKSTNYFDYTQLFIFSLLFSTSQEFNSTKLIDSSFLFSASQDFNSTKFIDSSFLFSTSQKFNPTKFIDSSFLFATSQEFNSTKVIDSSFLFTNS
jgi:hypothetical protein